ncbi:MerR family transcriptional regulator [Pacificibacter marinus]|uniref:MerR family transcriptional regulator n=1 Tax=Pacificibacter marinus TaxID=658057 RepID=UPI001C075A16|nr:MerR family transcriptional regulator [Pacificibacter marinus]MBU2868203.1 MerR family transcriptional regulator [Pacificibacter marinus]
MKIGELAKRSGLSTHTIRYYERIGLLPVADRDAGGRRDYDPSILIWTEFLGRLKTTGMSIQDMLRYARLREQGTHTGLERRAILETHREMVRRKLNALQVSLLVLDTKIDSYVDTEKRTHHDDNTPDRQFPDAAGTR